jgi:hypothetical protein
MGGGVQPIHRPSRCKVQTFWPGSGKRVLDANGSPPTTPTRCACPLASSHIALFGLSPVTVLLPLLSHAARKRRPTGSPLAACCWSPSSERSRARLRGFCCRVERSIRKLRLRRFCTFCSFGAQSARSGRCRNIKRVFHNAVARRCRLRACVSRHRQPGVARLPHVHDCGCDGCKLVHVRARSWMGVGFADGLRGVGTGINRTPLSTLITRTSPRAHRRERTTTERLATNRMRRYTASVATRCSHLRSTTTPTRQSIRTTRTRTRLPLSTTLPSNPRAAPSPHTLSLPACIRTPHAHTRIRGCMHTHTCSLSPLCSACDMDAAAAHLQRLDPFTQHNARLGMGSSCAPYLPRRAGGVVPVSQHWGRPGALRCA